MLTWTGAAGTAPVLDHISEFRLGVVQSAPGAGQGDPWWSVLLELTATSINSFICEAGVEGHSDELIVPAAYDAEDKAREAARQPVVVFARAGLIRLLNREANRFGVSALRLGGTVPDRLLDRDAGPPDQATIHVPKDAVVMAVIDDGIALAHDLMRAGPLVSRIKFASLMEAIPNGNSTLGRNLQGLEIDRLLAECSFNDLLDEDLFYRRSGQMDARFGIFSKVAHQASHGTQVMSQAAGCPMADQEHRRPIICAALPPRLVEDTSGQDFLPDLYLAFHILAKQAGRFRLPGGAPAPVVFNLSFGTIGGPNDGTGIFETLFEHYFGEHRQHMTQDQRAWLMLPVGNDNLMQLHGVVPLGCGDADEGRETVLELETLPDDRTATVVEFWLPCREEGSSAELAEIRVTAPGQVSAGSIRTRPGEVARLCREDGTEIARLACQYVGGETRRDLVSLSIQPSAQQDGRIGPAPAGTWRLHVRPLATAMGAEIQLRVWRDQALPGGQGGGRQAFLSDKAYRRFDRFGAPLPVDPPATRSHVRRAGTLSGFACGASPVVVAGYTRREADISGYSASGPLSPRVLPPEFQRSGPDLAALADESLLVRGTTGAGSRSGSWTRLSGTSVACPKAARVASDDIATFDGTARDWAGMITQRDPFPIRKGTPVDRMGAGGMAWHPPWPKIAP